MRSASTDLEYRWPSCTRKRFNCTTKTELNENIIESKLAVALQVDAVTGLRGPDAVAEPHCLVSVPLDAVGEPLDIAWWPPGTLPKPAAKLNARLHSRRNAPFLSRH